MPTLFLATGNAKKLQELHRVLQAADIANLDIVTTKDVNDYHDPVENGASFTENALIKARYAAHKYQIPALADDSGLCVDALAGMPGIFSARWSGASAEESQEERDLRNCNLLLAQLADIPLERRGAQFVSTCALVFPDGKEIVQEGHWCGTITFSASGNAGFGYDPIFAPSELDGTTVAAMLSAEDKDRFSHRGKALEALLPALRKLAQS